MPQSGSTGGSGSLLRFAQVLSSTAWVLEAFETVQNVNLTERSGEMPSSMNAAQVLEQLYLQHHQNLGEIQQLLNNANRRVVNLRDYCNGWSMQARDVNAAQEAFTGMSQRLTAIRDLIRQGEDRSRNLLGASAVAQSWLSSNVSPAGGAGSGLTREEAGETLLSLFNDRGLTREEVGAAMAEAIQHIVARTQPDDRRDELVAMLYTGLTALSA